MASIDAFSVNPGPLIRRTHITFRLLGHALVTVRVRRVSTGHIVRTLRHRMPMGPGRHAMVWWGKNDRQHRVLPGRFVVVAYAASRLGHARVAKRITVVRR